MKLEAVLVVVESNSIIQSCLQWNSWTNLFNATMLQMVSTWITNEQLWALHILPWQTIVHFAIPTFYLLFQSFIWYVGSILQRHCGNTFWAHIGIEESKVGWMDKVAGLRVNFLMAQTNGWACVRFGCCHPIDGLFWNLPIYLLGLFSKYECWVTDLTMFLHHFILFGLLLAFLYHEVSYCYAHIHGLIHDG
jgi:hypothetical protein